MLFFSGSSFLLPANQSQPPLEWVMACFLLPSVSGFKNWQDYLFLSVSFVAGQGERLCCSCIVITKGNTVSVQQGSIYPQSGGSSSSLLDLRIHYIFLELITDYPFASNSMAFSIFLLNFPLKSFLLSMSWVGSSFPTPSLWELTSHTVNNLKEIFLPILTLQLWSPSCKWWPPKSQLSSNRIWHSTLK